MSFVQRIEAIGVNAVVFDAVGTLIYPDPAVATIYTTVARQYGSARSEVEVERRFRAVFAECEQRDRAGDLRTSESRELRRWQTIVGRVLDDVRDPAACFHALFQHFARAAAWGVYPDVAPVFDELQRRGVLLAIASNFDRRLLPIASALAPLHRCPHVVVSSQVGFRKPHPAFFAAVQRTLGIPLDRVLYVGDDPRNDLQGARSAGMQAVWIQRRRRPAATTQTDQTGKP